MRESGLVYSSLPNSFWARRSMHSKIMMVPSVSFSACFNTAWRSYGDRLMHISVNRRSISRSLMYGKLDDCPLTASILFSWSHIVASVASFKSNYSGSPQAQSSFAVSLRDLIHSFATPIVYSSMAYRFLIVYGSTSGKISSLIESNENICMILTRLNFRKFLGIVSSSFMGLRLSFIYLTVCGEVLRLTTVF